MSHLPNSLRLIGQLLNYPGPETRQLVESLCAELQGELSDAARPIANFLVFAQQSNAREIEEVFTHTFDINPACALEVGWHLFGEEYIRGLFMVRMREELRKYDLRETVELPDHIAHVLSVVAAMPCDEATRFVCACVMPAVQKMNQALSGKETPYRHILSCLESVLTVQWGAAFEEACQQTDESQAAHVPRIDTVDPLRAFPIRDVTVDCDSCPRVPSDAIPQNLVPREIEFVGRGRQDETSQNESEPSAAETGDRCRSISPSVRATNREMPAASTPARKP